MKKKSLKQAAYLGAATLGLGLLDQAAGNSSLSEMANLMYHAPPNGNPIVAQASLFADNIERLSPFGLAGIVSGLGTCYKSIEGIFSKKK